MTTATESEALPEGVSSLIALARVAHREGNRDLERACTDRLILSYGITISFVCCESVDADLNRSGKAVAR